MKLNLIESKKDRESVMKGNLGNDRQIKSLLSGFIKADKVYDYWTEKMVADFYKVDKKCMNQLGCRNQDELKKYGYKVYKKSEIEKLQDVVLEKTQVGFLGKVPNRGLRLYPLRAVFLILF